MLKVGITGGIGSGKTTVCRVFEWLGIPVYYADDRAKWLMTHDAALRQGITELFGAEAYLPDGSLNRSHIAGRAFQDSEILKKLNSLVHPAVHRDGEEWHHAQNAPYTLREAALLYESGGYRLLDKMIVVTAPAELRIQRVTTRDGTERVAVEARIAQQWPEEEKVALADYIIRNDGETALLPQILEVHRRLLPE
ncbi:MAG: dephospho-CoA kinase [Saprospiraceae bacterium]|nr:dephospho-CoA kinase [Saprospiraceae bacterium]